MFVLILLLIFVVFTLLFFTRFYFKPITAICISDTLDISVSPVKPTKKFFNSVSFGKSSSFVNLGNGYIAYYSEQDTGKAFLYYNDIEFNSNVYIFKRSFLGRFKSIDLSDRCLFDVLKKFKGGK